MLSNVSKEWLELLDEKSLSAIEEKVDARSTTVCPPKEDWFNWARLTPLDSVRVIIIGQDPYYTKGTANGLAFSCTEKKVPPSLRNIYECLFRQKLIPKVPNHGLLQEWASRGVLLLNSAFSTELGKPNEHSDIWSEYVHNLVKKLVDYGVRKGVKYTFLLWGKSAQKFKQDVGDKHYVLEWAHPSPMAQTRLPDRLKFVQCNHFRICSERYGIDWSIGSYSRPT